MSNNQVIAVEFRDGMVWMTLADGRVIGNPLEWHCWLKDATNSQRANVEFHELSAYWPDLDDGLDVEEMVKGIPPRASQQVTAITSH